MSGPGFQGLAPTDPKSPGFSQKLVAIINRLLIGKTNNLIEVTLTANAATTTITDSRISSTTHLSWMPKTANAAAISLPYVADSGRLNGSVTVTHANDANADKTFSVALIG